MRPSEEFMKESPDFRPKPLINEMIFVNGSSNSGETSQTNQKYTEINSNDSIVNLINSHQEMALQN